MSGSSGGRTKTVDELNAEQRRISGLIRQMIETGLGEEPSLTLPEGGVPGIPQELYEGFNRYFADIENQGQATQALSGLLEGEPAFNIDPQQVSDLFQENVAAPAFDIFATEVQPIIEEQYGGDFYSSRRRNAVTRGALAEQSRLRQQLFQAQLFAQQLNATSAENAAGRIPGAVQTSLNQPFNQFQQTAGVAGTTQGAEVDYFNRLMQAQVQTSGASSPWFQAGQDFIASPTGETVAFPSSPWYQSSAAGAGIGAIASIIGKSDEVLKQNIEPYEGNALEVLKGINTKRFEFKSTPGGKEVGVIAQEVEKVLPEAVSILAGKKFVNTLTLIAVVIKAINELQKKIGEL